MSVRRATPADHDAILALVPRVAQASTPPHRGRADALAADRSAVRASLASDADDVAVLVAEEEGRVVGFVHVQTASDYYLRMPVGHVSDLAVAADAEGRGIARALMAAAEDWARQRGYPLLDLNVEVHNDAARQLYEKLGYAAEWTKYVKRL